jgi:[protein-PII] uridylyltransferase
VALWQSDAGGIDDVVALCVVADDAPGLFAKISAALVEHSIDIVTVQAFTRRREDGSSEAVDLLWVRRANAIAKSDVEAVGARIAAFVGGDVAFLPPRRVARAANARDAGTTRIRFEHDEASGETILTVEASDRAGLLLALTKTIFVARLQIVGMHAKSVRGRAVDRFSVAELDGSPVGQARRLELQSAILAAIDTREEERVAQ